MKETIEKTAALVLDNPDYDATDFAHPAWWRGNDEGVKRTVQIVNEILDGNHSRGRFADASLDLLRSRLINSALSVPAAAVVGEPEGWKLVPIEPTVEMLAAAADYSMRQNNAVCGDGYYRVMVSAAPPANDEMREALKKCQKALAAMIDPSCIAQTTVVNAFAMATEAEASARAALGGKP